MGHSIQRTATAACDILVRFLEYLLHQLAEYGVCPPMHRLPVRLTATFLAMLARGMATCLMVCALAVVAGCNSEPPSKFFARGSLDAENAPPMEIKDAYVWRQPAGNNAFVLLAERTLPPLPPDDPYAITDLGVLLDWSHSPYAVLAIDEHGTFTAFSTRSGGGGGTSAECAHNSGACYSAVGYWSAGTDWSDEVMLGSYEFGREVDVALAQPIHRQMRFQTPPLSEPGQAIDPQGKPRHRADGDFASMFTRYTRVREALDASAPQGFLEANGYSAALADAMRKFAGVDAGIARLAASCPRIDSYESFGDHRGSSSLLIHHGEDETPVYFIRRGDDWVLKECGGN